MTHNHKKGSEAEAHSHAEKDDAHDDHDHAGATPNVWLDPVTRALGCGIIAD